jgi:BirA family biotin operon repressor/biotin-[acetyl-CoA-carboxylase] ligase
LTILSFDTLPSTQLYLIEQIKKNMLTPPVAIWAKDQSDGIGSRENRWEGGEGNLFFSFALSLSSLPADLPLGSASIYFSFIMKEILVKYDDDIWLKWPNDLYHNQHKIGGVITKKIENILICGMGINLQKNSNGYEALNLNVEREFLLKCYFAKLKKYPSWKQVFSKYAIEFERRKSVSAHIEGEYKSLCDAILREDGSLIIDNKRVYSLR